MIHEVMAASLAEAERRESGGEVPEGLFDSLSTAHRAPGVEDLIRRLPDTAGRE